MWDAMEYAIHTHYTQIFETLIGISKELHELEINSYFNFEILILKQKFLLNMKVQISILKIIIWI
jgi:hypothetical protein